MNTKNNAPLNALRHHVTGAIVRGEAVAIAGITNVNTKHTPGPWLYSRENSSFMNIIETDGTHIFDMGALINSTGHSNLEANARLIAAAPELLEALQGVTRILEAFSYTTTLGKTQAQRLEAARAAIAKAVQA
jgi:hypothetical protein